MSRQDFNENSSFILVLSIILGLFWLPFVALGFLTWSYLALDFYFLKDNQKMRFWAQGLSLVTGACLLIVLAGFTFSSGENSKSARILSSHCYKDLETMMEDSPRFFAPGIALYHAGCSLQAQRLYISDFQDNLNQYKSQIDATTNQICQDFFKAPCASRSVASTNSSPEYNSQVLYALGAPTGLCEGDERNDSRQLNCPEKVVATDYSFISIGNYYRNKMIFFLWNSASEEKRQTSLMTESLDSTKIYRCAQKLADHENTMENYNPKFPCKEDSRVCSVLKKIKEKRFDTNTTLEEVQKRSSWEQVCLAYFKDEVQP